MNIDKYTLKNGIPLFIVETHASPVVSIQAWVRRGSVYEPPKLAGISHFLEHALFKGTKRRKVGEIANEIESRGGEINAFTSFEETAYYATLASRFFEDGLDVIADAVQNPSFDAEEMEREKEVILEEIRRAYDSPYKLLSMNLWKTCFDGTPYGRPVLGFEETVRKIDHKVLRTWFNQHYHTGTIALFIVGDIDKREALESTQRKFSKTRKGAAGSLPSKLRFPRFSKTRIISASRDLNESHLQLAIPSPGIWDPSIPVRDIMCSAAGQGEASRFYQRLVKETKLAQDVGLGLVATGLCGMTVIRLVTAPDKLESALEASYQVLSEIASTGLSEPVLERGTSSVEADVIGGKETVEGYARRLGYYYAQFGDPSYEAKYLHSLLAVDRDSATAALSETFSGRPILSIIHPKNHVPNKQRLQAACTFRRPKLISSATERTVPEIDRNGVRFVTNVVHSLRIFAFRFIFPGGAREE